MLKFFKFSFPIFATSLLFIGCQKIRPLKTGTVKITINNVVGSTPLVVDTGLYVNSFGENYTVSKFKYYISNVGLGFGGLSAWVTENNSYHLADQNLPASLSFSFDVPENNYTTLYFLLGVDSARNVSGAQTGALDPLNDMFWTWNSGYIMAKLEGASPQSNQFGNKIEYHIGGFSGANSVLKTMVLSLPVGKLAAIKEGKISQIILEADLDKWWQLPNSIKIAELPVCTTPGVNAKKIADNYSNMFKVIDVVNN